MSDATKPTLTEALKSLNGFDELALKERFGSAVLNLITDGDTIGSRALLWIRRINAGESKEAAYREVMTLTIDALDAEFSDDADFAGQEEDGSSSFVVTEAGKDFEPHA